MYHGETVGGGGYGGSFFKTFMSTMDPVWFYLQAYLSEKSCTEHSVWWPSGGDFKADLSRGLNDSI